MVLEGSRYPILEESLLKIDVMKLETRLAVKKLTLETYQ